MKKFIKRMAAVALAAAMLVTSIIPTGITTAYAQEMPQMIPIRATFEALGAEVAWVDEQVHVVMNGNTWVFTPGASTAVFNSYERPMVMPVSNIDDRAFISMPDAALTLEPTGQFSQTALTAVFTAQTMMEMMGITGLTMALVDAESGLTWTQALGYADSVSGHRANAHTLFQIGSISKPVTAVAVMQLVEQGVICLDEPIVTYIPEFSLLPNYILGGNSDNITTRMLLSNTSGIVTNWFNGFAVTGYGHYQGHMNGLLEWLPSREMSFPAGEMYEYANAGWTLLGILVARMTGHDNYFEGFSQFAEENIFAPIGMERSTFVFDSNITNFARPYATHGVQMPMFNTAALSAGSMFSSAYDMSLLMHELLGGERLLPQKTIDYMLQVHTPEGCTDYGLGFVRTVSADGFAAIGHSGGLINFFSDMIFNTESELGVFVSINSSSGAMIVQMLSNTILQTAVMEKTGNVPRVAPVSGVAIDPAAVPVELTAEELDAIYEEFGGVYSFGIAGVWTLELVNGVLTWFANISTAAAEMAGVSDVIELVPMSDGTFYADGSREIFTHDAEGNTKIISYTIMGIFPGVRARVEDYLAPEGFEQFVGVYTFVPQVTGEISHMSTEIGISISDVGVPMLGVTFPQHGYVEFMLRQIGNTMVADGPGMVLIFEICEDGVASIDMMGAQFER